MIIQEHAFIVTVNQRLARELTAQYSMQQIAAGKEVWESPQILPWSAWLPELWQTRVDQHSEKSWLLLSKQQSQVIWEEVIRQSPATNGLLQVAETTRVAMVAWQLLQGWEISLEQLSRELLLGTSQETNVFYQWAKVYKQRLESENWLDPEQLPGKLIEACEAKQLRLPENLTLAGFEGELDQTTPQQQRLLSAIQAFGCQIEKIHQPALSTKAMRVACNDSDEEIYLAARRCRYLLEESHSQNQKNNHNHHNNSVNLQIGVIVPDLQQRKNNIASIFEDTLTPGAVFSGEKSTSLFNISLGDSLSSLALIKTALLIFDAAVGRLPLEDLSRLIRSPFIAAAETEMTARTVLDVRLRQIGDESISLALLVSEADSKTETERDPDPWQCPRLASSFSAFMQLSEQHDIRKKHSAVEWMKFFDSLLNALGWPGERTLNSKEYQAYEAWRDLREQFVSLERVMSDVSLNMAVQQLQKIASDKVFQVETSSVSIQVMGLLEASGLQFDHVLLLGMTDEKWPQKASPNPFLPYKLQRQRKMPHASAEREYLFARAMTKQLLQSAQQVIVSYPLNKADQQLNPSPLITHLPEVTQEQIGVSAEQDLYRLIKAAKQPGDQPGQLEKLIDHQARPLAENQHWQGGVGVFKDQAACPFKAFARHRLRADMLGEAEAGLNPAERGSLVHAALEQLWGRLKSHEHLVSLTAEQLNDCIVDSARQAVDEFHTAKSLVLAMPFQNLEITRLQKLLGDWIQVEIGREPFTVIAQEEVMEITLAGISVKTRVDRIDRLASGERAVIDYKTGNPSVNDWAGDRPDEPQLPLYAAYLEGPDGPGRLDEQHDQSGQSEQAPQAVLFAKLKKGEQGFIGLANDMSEDGGQNHGPSYGLGKRVKSPEQDWDELITYWRVTLENLAAQFKQGYAQVDPKDLNKSCQYCDYHSLCRIDEVITLPDSQDSPDSQDPQNNLQHMTGVNQHD